MNLFTRLQVALQTPLGDLLIFLVLCTLVVSFFYLYFWLRFAKSKNPMLRHTGAFKMTERALKEITFIDLGVADFFGKSQIVALADGRFAKSLIFYPELTTKLSYQRFRNYHAALHQKEGSSFPKNLIHERANLLVDIETQYVKRDGKSLINFAHFAKDPAFTLAEKEHFLMDLAHRLQALHETHTEQGEPLYHGFLLPQSFYLTVDMVKRITQMFVAYHGCAFSIGKEALSHWLEQVLTEKITIDPEVKEQIKEYAFILAPEQVQRNTPHEMGQPSDFYSFGALAVYLFTGEGFSEPSKINYDQIPHEWKPFIQECLHENPLDRPQNFHELKEYFSNPELTLGQCFSATEALSFSHDGEDVSSALKPFFDQIHRIKQDEPTLTPLWHQGYAAIKNQAWDEAIQIFKEMMKDDSQTFNAHLGLALTHFQKGEHEQAKYHYFQAKKIDGKKISSFYRLIAFEI